MILCTTPTVLQAWGHVGSNPGHAFGVSWSTVAAAYSSLVEGSIFNPHAQGLTQAFNPISETLVAATPLMLAGLGVGLGFSTGVFNIGGQGQLIAGAVAALWVGTEIKAPIGIHIPLVILAGAVGGAVAGFIPGILKATTGAHEVITTIMLNYVFLDLLDCCLLYTSHQGGGGHERLRDRVEGLREILRVGIEDRTLDQRRVGGGDGRPALAERVARVAPDVPPRLQHWRAGAEDQQRPEDERRNDRADGDHERVGLAEPVQQVDDPRTPLRPDRLARLLRLCRPLRLIEVAGPRVAAHASAPSAPAVAAKATVASPAGAASPEMPAIIRPIRSLSLIHI